jgi:Domain of unknown function (DUF1918)
MAAKGAMHMPAKITPGHSGDRIEIASIGGAPARRGQILEVLGGPHHEHYLVRWEDGRESIHYPSDGTKFIPATHAAGKA